MRPTAKPAALLGAAALLAIVMFAAAAAPREPDSDSVAATRPTPAPAFTQIVEAVPRAEFLRYATTLVFDTSYHAAETRRLSVRENGKLLDGPLATIAPEIGATALQLEDLERGRIIARIVSDGSSAHHGLTAGANYVWIEQRNGSPVAAIIPADPTGDIHWYSLKIRHLDLGPSRMPEARFRWSESAGRDLPWERCLEGCCEMKRR
jgi:hypothetical protein